MSKFTFIIFLFVTGFVDAQVDQSDELHLMLQKLDSTLFDAVFNTCDMEKLESMVSEKCEFFHDKSGYTSTKAGFIESIENGLCKMEYKPRRAVIQESLETFPLQNRGTLYGAIQRGKHQFYAKYPNNPKEQLTSVALFTHVWMLEGGEWKLAKVLSFDHQAP